jgi:hypothetical protein
MSSAAFFRFQKPAVTLRCRFRHADDIIAADTPFMPTPLPAAACRHFFRQLFRFIECI